MLRPRGGRHIERHAICLVTREQFSTDCKKFGGRRDRRQGVQKSSGLGWHSALPCEKNFGLSQIRERARVYSCRKAAENDVRRRLKPLPFKISNR
jgi:hypothetical protein